MLKPSFSVAEDTQSVSSLTLFLFCPTNLNLARLWFEAPVGVKRQDWWTIARM
jgi:hypothetical protein